MHSNKTKNKSKNETRLKALIVATLLILSSFVYFAISSTTFAASSDTLIEFRIDPPACVHNNPTILVSPTNRRVNPGGSTTYSVAVINNDSIGCGVATFNLSFTNLAGFPFSPATGSVTLAPGAASATQVITVTTPSYSALGVYSLSFRVTNSAFSTFTHLQTVTLTVVAPTPPEPPEPPEPPAPLVKKFPAFITLFT